MIIETGKIERGDRVYASMIKSGKVLAELRCDTTVSGMTDVYKALCRLSPMVKGFVKVSVSNRTRGWSKTLSLLVGREMPPGLWSATANYAFLSTKGLAYLY